MKVAFIGALLFALAGCGGPPSMEAQTVRYSVDYPVYSSLNELYAKADLVVSVTLARTAEVRPATPTVPTVHTVFTATVEHAYKGEAPADLLIKQEGGRRGGTDYIEVGSARLQAGGHYLVFLEVYEDAPASLLNPNQGQYRLDDADTVTPVDAAGLRFALADVQRLAG